MKKAIISPGFAKKIEEDIEELNSNMPVIKIITGSLPATGQSALASFPSGFNESNTVILNGQYKASGETVWRTFVGGYPLSSASSNEVSTTVAATGINITSRGTAVGGATYKIALLKQT